MEAYSRTLLAVFGTNESFTRTPSIHKKKYVSLEES